jgi:uncharacterized protein YukE
VGSLEALGDAARSQCQGHGAQSYEESVAIATSAAHRVARADGATGQQLRARL